MSASDLLEFDEVVTGYGHAPVLHGVSLSVEAGDIAVILGSNGAGKTTTLRTASGVLRAWRGAVRVEGRDVTRMRPERLVRLGVGVVPEAPAVFRDLSVLDNLHVGGFALGRDRRRIKQRVAEVLGFFPRLAGREHQVAGSLSGGEQRMLAVGRALMAVPRLLLLDEVSMGLSPAMVHAVIDVLSRIRDTGVTVCLVEQNPAALQVADRAYVLANGVVTTSAAGTDVAELRAETASLYLGSK